MILKGGEDNGFSLKAGDIFKEDSLLYSNATKHIGNWKEVLKMLENNPKEK